MPIRTARRRRTGLAFFRDGTPAQGRQTSQARALAGLLGGKFDCVAMRVIDVLSSLPSLLFYNLLLAVTMLTWVLVGDALRDALDPFVWRA